MKYHKIFLLPRDVLIIGFAHDTEQILILNCTVLSKKDEKSIIARCGFG
jgi:hypothetical protein